MHINRQYYNKLDIYTFNTEMSTCSLHVNNDPISPESSPITDKRFTCIKLSSKAPPLINWIYYEYQASIEHPARIFNPTTSLEIQLNTTKES